MAVIAIEKLKSYCLNPEHPDGRHKARVFFAVLGITAAHADELRGALASAAACESAEPGVFDMYGKRYIVDFRMNHKTRIAVVRSCWLIGIGETAPRLITCYVL